MTLKQFMNGYCFYIFDLSTSGNSAIDFVTPTVKTGVVQLKVQFSSVIPKELSIIYWAEFPSSISINKFRQISMSYL